MNGIAKYRQSGRVRQGSVDLLLKEELHAQAWRALEAKNTKIIGLCAVAPRGALAIGAARLRHHPAMTLPLAISQALGHPTTDRRIDILRNIGACGSISQAARAVGVSYKAAWQALDTLSNLAGAPLVERVVGGAGGGGAVLTPAGEELLAAAGAMAQARGAVLERWQAAPLAGPALAGLAVRTSMRNQWPCRVERIEGLGQIVRVHLALGAHLPERAAAGERPPKAARRAPAPQPAELLPDGAAPLALASRITRESAELLGLRAGQAVQALCKATAVRIERWPRGAAPGLEHGSGTGLYRLPGRAVRVVRGEVGDEVSCTLDGGLQMVGFAASRSGLRAGSRVALCIEENAVVLAPGGW